MRVFRSLSCVLFLVVLLYARADSTALKIEPTKPMVRGSEDNNGTRELRITYFTDSPKAKIKNPQQLVLQMGVNDAQYRNSARSVPFVHKDVHRWEATVFAAPNDVWLYLIFQVKDEKTGQIDDNGGHYWDVVFYEQDSQLHVQAIEEQAKSYTGVHFRNGIARLPDFAAATAILERYINGNDSGRFNVLADYWGYKVRRDGGNDAAWSKMEKEIDGFLNGHRLDDAALIGASNFIINHEDRLPQLAPKVMHMVEAIDPKERASLEGALAYSRIEHEKDPRRKAERLDEFIKKYPLDLQTELAAIERFRILQDLGDVPGAETAFQQRIQTDRNWPDTYAWMATVYIENNVKLAEAMKLLDQSAELLKGNEKRRKRLIDVYSVLSPNEKKSEATLAYWRARAYLLQGQGDLALPFAQRATESQKDLNSYIASDRYFILGQAYEATGDKQRALDAYLRAVLMPSKKHWERMEHLQQLWISGSFGTGEQLQAKIRSLQEEEFNKAEYVPELVDFPAPEFEFVTLKGERFRSGNLRGKTIVLNFWATWCGPCIPELPGFQELQAKHPEVFVAALVVRSDLDMVRKLLHEQKLDTLRVAQADDLETVFVNQGLPETYVIDGGRVRVFHAGLLNDVVAYIEADVSAIRNKGSQAE